MTTSQPTLSICIPTYNRPKELSETLRILGDQLDQLTIFDRQKIEIIVSDNHSQSGESVLVFDQWAKYHPDAVLHVQLANVGPTMNFEYCYRSSRGRFVFILSDDDHLCPGALDHILAALQDDEPDILFLPFFPLNQRNQAQTSIRLKLERNEFLRQTNLLPTLVSACIFNKAKLASCLGRYLDTNMHHFYYFLHVLETSENFVYLNHQILYSPYEENSGGYNWFKAFAGDFSRIVDEFPSQRIDRTALYAIKREMFIKRIIPIYVNRKITGYAINHKFVTISNLDTILLISKRSYNLAAYWLLFLPIVITPKWMLKIIRKMYIRTRSFFTQVSLRNA